MSFPRMQKPTIEEARKMAMKFVWCQGWSPKEGTFGRAMPELGYRGEIPYSVGGGCSAELRHPNSGCKNVTVAPLSMSHREDVAQKILAKMLTKYEADQPRRSLWEAIREYCGRSSYGLTEIGDDLAHVLRESDRSVAVFERIDGKWIVRGPLAGERVYA